MHDARDAEDALLLAAGDHAVLLAAYADVVVQRCLVATRDEAGYDVAQNVFLRLWQELGRGKRYPVPYRRVVHNVIDWTLKEHMDGLEIRRSPTASVQRGTPSTRRSTVPTTSSEA